MTLKVWFYGLLHAAVGSAATSITLMITDPATFNLSDLKKLGHLIGISALVSAAMYLKQSPLPLPLTSAELGAAITNLPSVSNEKSNPPAK